MSRRGRYAIDTMKRWAANWNLKMPVPPYDDVNYWEGVYRTTNINTDPPFEWGNLSCADLLTHSYTPIDLQASVPSFSAISLPQQQQQQQQHHPHSNTRTASSPVKVIQVRRKNQTHPTKNNYNKNYYASKNNTGSATARSNAISEPSEIHPSSSSSSSSSSSATTNTTTTTAPITTTLGELLGNVHPSTIPSGTDDQSILILGCGTSQFGADLLRHQWTGPIIQLDCSSRLIDSITNHPLYMDYIASGEMIALHDDATVLSAVQDNTIQAVFDKGLIDAFFCTDNYTYVSSALSSVHRVLRPNATFCTLSLSHPHFLLPKFTTVHVLGWGTNRNITNATTTTTATIVRKFTVTIYDAATTTTDTSIVESH